VIELAPVLGDAADHAHGRDRLGIAPAGLQQRIACNRKLGGASRRMTGFHFSNDRQRDKDNGADECGEPNIGVEQKTDRQIDRHPRQIEEGNRFASGKKAAHGIQIAHRLRAVAFGADFQRQADDRVVDPRTHRLIEAATDPDHDSASDRVDHALGGVETGHQEEKRDQSRHAPAGQDTIVDFEHEQRASEH